MKSVIDLPIDAIVMLTTSNWFTELRSNRYHYATRLAKLYPIIFVQPFLAERNYAFEATEHDNITVLHLYQNYGEEQTQLLNDALAEKKIHAPMLWIYNARFADFIENCYSPLRVYHATEDHFALGSPVRLEDNSIWKTTLMQVLQSVDLIMCVSKGVQESLIEHASLSGETFVNSNGCDYEFYSKDALMVSSKGDKKIVFYQGNIYDKLDFDLLHELAIKMPHWDFHFCGRTYLQNKKWDELLTLPNVKYLGELSVEDVREHAYMATVGIIPFTRSQYLKERTFPLKAFEYLACGLPVVTTPIDALAEFPGVFHFATDCESFKAAIEEQSLQRFNEKSLKFRLEQASLQSYNKKFQHLITKLNVLRKDYNATLSVDNKMRLLVLYEPKSILLSALKEHLESFKSYSHHNIEYCGASEEASSKLELSTSCYDAVIVHYSLKVNVASSTETLSPFMASALEAYRGLKILFIQDEYDSTTIAKAWIKRLGVHVVYTCVPEESIESVYPAKEFPITEFISMVQEHIPQKSTSLQPISPEKHIHKLDAHISLLLSNRKSSKDPVSLCVNILQPEKITPTSTHRLSDFPTPALTSMATYNYLNDLYIQREAEDLQDVVHTHLTKAILAKNHEFIEVTNHLLEEIFYHLDKAKEQDVHDFLSLLRHYLDSREYSASLVKVMHNRSVVKGLLHKVFMKTPRVVRFLVRNVYFSLKTISSKLRRFA